ncbi:GNAT family acetyltransferase [Comamonas piscis]
MMEIRVFALQDSEAVVQLWHDCGLYRAWNDPHKDIARKLSVSPALFWVGVDARGEVMASIMVGYDGHRGWINYLAVHPSQQRKGYAGQLMQRAEAELTALGCPKLNLQVRVGNEAVIAFYESQGYSNDQTVSLGKRLIADT